MGIRLFFIIIIYLLSNLNVSAQELDIIKKTLLDQEITKNIKGLMPGMAIGIIRKNRVVYTNYSGYSNLEHSVKINPKTRFNIASNAKQFTALCILKLQEEGLLDINDDIRKYLPSYFKSIKEPIRIYNLLNHTSGIRDVYNLWALQGKTWWKLFINNKDALSLLKKQTDVNFKPGTNYLYSNSNYILLTALIKKITGTSFANYTKSLFKELGMSTTSFLTNHMDVIPNKAQPYGNWNGWKQYPSITELYGDGGLFTTLNDQLKWELLLQNKDTKVVSNAIIDKSQQLIKTNVDVAYGYGLEFGTYKGIHYRYHNGNTGAYNATFLRFPNTKLTIIVLSNNGSISTNYVAKIIADILLEPKEEIVNHPAMPLEIQRFTNLEDLTGVYRTTDDGNLIKIVERNGALYREIYQRKPVKLVQENQRLFYYENNKDLKINFTYYDGKQQFKIYLGSQPPITGTKVAEQPLAIKNREDLNGSYYNEETDTKITIAHVDKDTYYLTKNGRKREATLLLKDCLRMNAYTFKITRDYNGMVNGLLVMNDRIRNVVFTKQ